MFSGIGTLTRALRDGLSRHVETRVIGCVEVDSRYMALWAEQHLEASTFAGSCGLYHAAELSLPKSAPDALRVAVFGIPCTGASVAGRSKNGLAAAEEHDQVGHLFLYVSHYLRRHRSELVVLENVGPYRKTMGAQALRDTLKGLGYQVSEYILDSHLQFEAPTQRVRWGLVASRIGAFGWVFNAKAFAGTLDGFLDQPSAQDEAESATPKQVEADAKHVARKRAEGCGWKTVILDHTSTKAPTILLPPGKPYLAAA